MNNLLHNCKNPYQGEEKKVLCVCSAGLLRSPTAAQVLAVEYEYNTRSCGTDIDHALIPLSHVLLFWADEIVCMDERQGSEIRKKLEEFNKEMIYIPNHTPSVRVLNIPDKYSRGDKELKKLILDRYHEVTIT